MLASFLLFAFIAPSALAQRGGRGGGGGGSMRGGGSGGFSGGGTRGGGFSGGGMRGGGMPSSGMRGNAMSGGLGMRGGGMPSSGLRGNAMSGGFGGMPASGIGGARSGGVPMGSRGGVPAMGGVRGGGMTAAPSMGLGGSSRMGGQTQGFSNSPSRTGAGLPQGGSGMNAPGRGGANNAGPSRGIGGMVGGPTTGSQPAGGPARGGVGASIGDNRGRMMPGNGGAAAPLNSPRTVMRPSNAQAPLGGRGNIGGAAPSRQPLGTGARAPWAGNGEAGSTPGNLGRDSIGNRPGVNAFPGQPNGDRGRGIAGRPGLGSGDRPGGGQGTERPNVNPGTGRPNGGGSNGAGNRTGGLTDGRGDRLPQPGAGPGRTGRDRPGTRPVGDNVNAQRPNVGGRPNPRGGGIPDGSLGGVGSGRPGRNGQSLGNRGNWNGRGGGWNRGGGGWQGRGNGVARRGAWQRGYWQGFNDGFFAGSFSNFGWGGWGLGGWGLGGWGWGGGWGLGGLGWGGGWGLGGWGWGGPAFGFSSFGLGLNSWCFGSPYYYWGYQPFFNPYYASVALVDPTPLIIGGTAGGTAFDYSQPLNTQAPAAAPSDEDLALQDFESARDAFRAGQYQAALQATDQALARTPQDAALHEFRALTMFALGRFDDAAAVIYPVLAVGPGWNWETLIGLYPNVDTYTQQLRALEAYRVAHPDSAGPAFLLAYHYLTMGHKDNARNQLESVVKLQPDDRIAQGLLKTLADKPAAVVPEPPKLDVPAQQFPIGGSWTAKPDAESTITLTVSDNGEFSWKVDVKSEPRTISGTSTIGNTGLLTLASQGAGVMVGQVTWTDADHFNFKLSGADADDPGLDFSRTR